MFLGVMTSLPQMPTVRSSYACAVWGNSLIVTGGKLTTTSGSYALSLVESFDLE